ncbi:MAG: hypothetical protein GQ529_11780 [Methyloprofundus sp.]|nr:hypothetical protein [Methyloprofundus sp.]
MAKNFGFTVVLGKQANSRLRNCFSSAAVGTKDKSDSGIIEFSILSVGDIKKDFQAIQGYESLYFIRHIHSKMGFTLMPYFQFYSAYCLRLRYWQ